MPRPMKLAIAYALLLGDAVFLVAGHTTWLPWRTDGPNMWWIAGSLAALAVVIIADAGIRPPKPAGRHSRPADVDDGVTLRGREGESAWLRGFAGPGGRLVVITGPSGIGSSTLAAHVAAAVTDPGLFVARTSYRSPEHLIDAFAGFAIDSGLPVATVEESLAVGAAHAADVVWRHFDSLPGVVLIVDGVGRPPAAQAAPGDGLDRGWLRTPRSGLLVLTAAPGDAEAWASRAEILRLGPLPDAAAAAVVFDHAPGRVTAAEAVAIGRRLGGLPLALRIAGATAARSGSGTVDSATPPRPDADDRPDPTAAREAAETTGGAGAAETTGPTQIAELTHDPEAADVPETPAVTETPDVTDAVTAAHVVGVVTEAALDHLDASGIPTARPLLSLLSLLADAPVPLVLLTTALVTEATGTETTDAAIQDALAGLRECGLADTPGAADRTVTLHPLVRATVAARIEDADREKLRAALDRAIVAWTTGLDPTDRTIWETAALVLPHTATLAGLRSDDPAAVSAADSALGPLAETLHLTGRSHDSVTIQRISAAALRRGLGPDNPVTLAMEAGIGAGLYELGLLTEGVATIEAALARLEALAEPDAAMLAYVRHNLAVAYRKLDRVDEAMALYGPVLAHRENVAGADHPDTIVARSNFAHAHTMAGRTAEGFAMQQAAADAAKRVLGPEHPTTLTCRRNLAVAHLHEGRVDEGLAMLDETLTDRRRMLGDDHPDVHVSRADLAEARATFGRGRRRRARPGDTAPR